MCIGVRFCSTLVFVHAFFFFWGGGGGGGEEEEEKESIIKIII